MDLNEALKTISGMQSNSVGIGSANPFITPLNIKDRLGYEVFKQVNNIGDNRGLNTPYDMQGFYKQEVAPRSLVERLFGDSGATEMMPDGLHYTDQFKTPFHPSFSNESQYKMPGMNREWKQNALGEWELIDLNTGNTVRSEQAAFAFPGLLRG